MPRKKKKTEYELWQERKAEVEKELEEVKRISQEAERLANIVAYKAKQLKESDPNSCKNCKHKHKCPFYDVATGEKTYDCLKEHTQPTGWRRVGRGSMVLLASTLYWKS